MLFKQHIFFFECYYKVMGAKTKTALKILLVLLVAMIFFFAIYLILYYTGWWEKLNSVDKLKKEILDLGIWGRSFFVLLQFLQVTFIPIPSPFVVIAGSLIYGPLQASLLSLAGILLGSAVAFAIGRIFGKKIVVFIVGKETEKKWSNFLSNAKYSFVLMMLLPLFPDDVLCMIAGLTDMSWTFFMVTQIFTRTIGVFTMSYLSGGDIIPYSGWGLYVWGLIAIVSVLAIYFSTKYNKQIETFIYKIFKKKTVKKEKQKER